MDDPDPLKAADARGYARGYRAGRRRARVDRSERALRAHENALWQRALLAAMPFALTQSTWKFGDQPISSINDRMELAARMADRALYVARARGKVMR